MGAGQVEADSGPTGTRQRAAEGNQFKKMVSPLARRSAVKYLVEQRRSSQRRACVVVGLSRSLVNYIASRRGDEAELIKKIHELAIRNSRYGYRRITVLLRLEGWQVNKISPVLI